jgi:hypothetical protein
LNAFNRFHVVPSVHVAVGHQNGLQPATLIQNDFKKLMKDRFPLDLEALKRFKWILNVTRLNLVDALRCFASCKSKANPLKLKLSTNLPTEVLYPSFHNLIESQS